MSKELQPHIWSLGNIVCFGVFNEDEAFEIAKQLFPYESLMQRVPARTTNQNPIMENDRGQYLMLANWIQRLEKRSCIMRRMVSEQERDKLVRHVPRTTPVTMSNNYARLNELKDELLRKRAVRVHDALEQINRRSQEPEAKPATPPTVS